MQMLVPGMSVVESEARLQSRRICDANAREGGTTSVKESTQCRGVQAHWVHNPR